MIPFSGNIITDEVNLAHMPMKLTLVKSYFLGMFENKMPPTTAIPSERRYKI